MPETTLLFNKNDEEEFAKFLLTEGCLLIPDYFYSSQNYTTIQTVDDFIDSRRKSGRFSSQWIAVQFFILGPWPQGEQLYLRPIEREGRQVFSISQREGAFALMLGLPVSECVDGMDRLAIGDFAHWPKYWSRVYETEVPPPEEMKEFYKKAKSFIVKNSKPYRMLGKIYRMGLSACEELAAGRAFVFDYSKRTPKKKRD